MYTRTETNLSDRDIVPESYQNRLMLWRDTFTKGYFEIGRIANELKLLHKELDAARVESAVGRFCGKSGRTVRDYAEIAAFYPEEIVDEYEVLPFSHFRFAKSCGGNWQEVLDYSAANPGSSEDAISVWYIGKFLTPEINVCNYASSLPSDTGLGDMQVDSESENGVNVRYPYPSTNPDIYALNELVNRSRSLLSADLSPQVYNDLKDCLERLQRLLPLIAGQIGVDSELRFEYNSICP